FKGDVDTTVAPTFKDGSTTKEVPGEGTYTIDKDGKVTFTPEKDFVGTATPVEVVRKDKNGKTIKASYTPTVRPDTKFVVVGKDGKETELLPSKDGKNPSETISGYKLVKTETDEKGNTKHIYEPVTTKHVDRKGNPIPGTTTEEGTKEPKNIPGYQVVETKKLPNGDTEYVYEKVTTRYVDQAGHPIPGTEIEEGTKEPKNIPGYKLVSTTTSRKGDTVHTYAPVQTFFKDKDGNVIPGITTEDGEQPKKDIPGYRFVETKKLPNGDVEHIYEKVESTPTPAPTPSTPVYEKVLTTYVDENGELIIPDENGSHPGKELKGYEIVRTEKDANGNVRNVYRKVTPATPEAKVMTTFVDENGTLIIPNENGEVPAKDIAEYELVRTEKDANGNVRHIYRKVVAPAPKVVETTPAKQEKVNRQELPNTGTGQESAILGAAASAILAGLGLVAPKRNKKDEE
ncbi:MucBP domain-containing protein, partial [uncultured Granulicatella sp.]|uniref:MucBP domain-containing protein n=1 Tax=uncultured Granulicatella sp. TaxID=316089 RepID=UPI0028E7363F